MPEHGCFEKDDVWFVNARWVFDNGQAVILHGDDRYLLCCVCGGLYRTNGFGLLLGHGRFAIEWDPGFPAEDAKTVRLILIEQALARD